MKLEWRPVEIDGGPAIDTSLTLAEADRLRQLADGANVLEVGTAYGYSTIVMARVAKTVVAVDPHVALDSYTVAVSNMRAYGVRNKVEMMTEGSPRALEHLLMDGRAFDLAWIDGDHEEAAVERDVRWARRLLRPNGILVCHDYGEDTCPGVKVALDRLFGGPGELLTDTLTAYHGYGGDGPSRRHFANCALVATSNLTCTCGPQ